MITSVKQTEEDYLVCKKHFVSYNTEASACYIMSIPGAVNHYPASTLFRRWSCQAERMKGKERKAPAPC
ncbi:unnamed protein product [Coccothraustes coccothraustes]